MAGGSGWRRGVLTREWGQRLSKCTEALAAQSELRQAAQSEVLPEGWHKAVAAHDASALYYRLGAGASEGVLQTAPPPNTRLQPLAAYGASPDALPDALGDDSAGAWQQWGGAVSPCGATQVAPRRAPMPVECCAAP